MAATVAKRTRSDSEGSRTWRYTLQSSCDCNAQELSSLASWDVCPKRQKLRLLQGGQTAKALQ